MRNFGVIIQLTKEVSKMNISEIIKKRREELGLSLEQVANYVGVNSSTVSRWETGDINNMIKWYNFFKYSKISQNPLK